MAFDPYSAGGFVPVATADQPLSTPTPPAPTTTAPAVDPTLPTDIPYQRISPSAAPAPESSPPTKATTFDPISAGGFVPDGQAPAATPSQPATAPSASALPPNIAAQELRNQPWYQPIADAVGDAIGVDLTRVQHAAAPGQSDLGGLRSLTHGLSVGLDEILDPLVPAVVKSLSDGTPFTQAYDEAVKEKRAARVADQAANPIAAGAAEIAGLMPSAIAGGPLFGEAAPGAGMLARGATAARNLAAGAALGGATGFTMEGGDVSQRLAAARQGAQFGAGAQAASSTAARVIGALPRVFAPGAASTTDQMAGGILREQAGLAPGEPVPPVQPPPIPGMPVGAGAAMNNPGLAARERLVNATDDTGALAVRTAQNEAVRNAASALPTGVAGAVLPSPAEASASVVRGLQDAHGVLKSEEERLWNKPSLTRLAPAPADVSARVQRAISALPQRFQNALARNADVYNALQDLYHLEPGATLADFNAARSDILTAARSLPYSERFAKKAALDAAHAVLDAIESNPALRTNPAALADYRAARAFTNKMHSALDMRQFQRMLQATEGNTKGLDAGTLAAGMFNFGKGTEVTPGGMSRILGMLDDVRRQWGALGTAAGAPLAGLDPAVAANARSALARGTREFITSSMLDSAASRVRDQSDQANVMMNAISEWLDTNRGWIGRSGLFSTPQLDLLDHIHNAAIMAARLDNLKGGAGSRTYESLAANRYVDVFLGPLFSRIAGVTIGAGAGALAAKLMGEAGIGGEIGLELMGMGAPIAAGIAGPPILRSLYAVPRDKLMARLNEAIRDPVIAADLMRRGDVSVTPTTRRWFRALLSEAPSSAMAENHP